MRVKGYLGDIAVEHGRVTISKRLRGATVIPLGSVTAVEIVRAGVGMRAIRLSVAGGSLAPTTRVLGTHRSYTQDAYALTFRAGRTAEFERVRDLIWQAR